MEHKDKIFRMLDRGRSLLGEGDYGKWDIKTRFSVCWTEVEACLERETTENGTLRQDSPYFGQSKKLVGRGRIRKMEHKYKIFRILKENPRSFTFESLGKRR